MALRTRDESLKRNHSRATRQRRAIPFWSRIDRTGGKDACWPWTFARNKCGYGRYDIWDPEEKKRLNFYAHRYAYQDHFKKVVTSDLRVCHRCDNPPCCNPGHLFVGTDADNIRDRDQKGRTSKGPVRSGEKHSQAKLTWPIVRLIRSSKMSAHKLGPRLGISFGMICRIRRRLAWKNDPGESS